jgi:DNA polymerase I-like protein with 3'-5' exonuclease and polymerase domains/uracil-DNA glycosylase
MSFFYNATKKAPANKAAPKLRGEIPIASLKKMGCSVCPKDKDDSLRSPKMLPDGPKRAPVYLLMANPSEDDDAAGVPLGDKVGTHIIKKFGRDFFEDHVRAGYVTQCHGSVGAQETACCHNRVVADIEATKPKVVVGIGDEVMKWVISPGMHRDNAPKTALAHRGTLFVTKIGNHVCYYYQLLYPNYFHKKKKHGKSEYEMAFEHDIEHLKAILPKLKEPKFYEAPYDDGIEIITGNEPGDMQRLEAALKKIAALRKAGLDIETNGLRPYSLKNPMIATVAVGTFNYTVAFALDHPEGWGTEARRKKVWSLFTEFLRESGAKVCHNLAMEMEWLEYFVGGKLLRLTDWEDTMAMAHTLDERKGTKGLAMQTRIHFGFDVKAQSNIDVTRLLEYPLKDVLRYNGMDTKWEDLLDDYLRPLIEADPAYKREYERKVRLAPTLVLTETKGMHMDLEYASNMLSKMNGEIKTIEAKIKRCTEVRDYERRYGTFEPSNPTMVMKLLKDICQRDEIRVEERDGSERWTTDEEALAKIPTKEVPSAGLILEHRAIAKLTGTYIEPVLSRKIICTDGKVRGKYSSMVAETGRLNCEDPNLQNWPKRKHKEVRGIVYAPPGEWMLACDYGQLEFRVVGMASEDPNLVKYCWTGYDVHKYWAERMVKEYPAIKDYVVEAFGVDWDEKGIKTLRQEAKNGWVFPQLFGSSVRSCAEQLHLPEDIADDLAAEFWDEFKGVKKWQDKLLANYEKNLYVETLGGRKRRGPMTKNQIINHPIQGTGADIVLEGMNVLSEKAQFEDDPLINPNINVHDDLTFIVPDAVLEDKISIITREMCMPRFDYINVPLLVEVSVGQRWNELEEIKKVYSHELFGHRNPYATA